MGELQGLRIYLLGGGDVALVAVDPAARGAFGVCVREGLAEQVEPGSHIEGRVLVGDRGGVAVKSLVEIGLGGIAVPLTVRKRRIDADRRVVLDQQYFPGGALGYPPGLLGLRRAHPVEGLQGAAVPGGQAEIIRRHGGESRGEQHHTGREHGQHP